MPSRILMLSLIVASAVETIGAAQSPPQGASPRARPPSPLAAFQRPTTDGVPQGMSPRVPPPSPHAAFQSPTAGGATRRAGPGPDPEGPRGDSRYLWVLCEVSPTSPPRPVGGLIGMWPTIDLIAPGPGGDGQAAFLSLFDAAITKGVENAIIRAFNTTKVVPDGRGGSPRIVPPLPRPLGAPGGSPEDPAPGPGPTGPALVPPSGTLPVVPPSAGPPPRPGRNHTPLEQIWYSGASAEMFFLDFSNGPPRVIRGAPARRGPDPGGTASFTDPVTGRLRLYTDGQTLFNGQTHAPLEDGTALGGGRTAGGPALIVPAPGGGRDLFYIVTDDGGWISYSVADLSEGPDGKVVFKNQPLADDAGGALGVVPHRDGRSLWVLVFHTAARLDAYLLDAASGVAATPVSSPTGFDGEVRRGSIVRGPDDDTLALGVGGRGIAIARIDRATGTLDEVKIRALGPVGAGGAFSPDGTKLYFARGDEGASGTPWQLDLRSGRETALSRVGGFGVPKLAPDGKVYWTGPGKPYLSVVQDPDAPGEAAHFVLWAVGLQGARGTSHLPTQTAASLDYLPENLRGSASDRAATAPTGRVGQDVVAEPPKSDP
jgi:hypothetical protein